MSVTAAPPARRAGQSRLARRRRRAGMLLSVPAILLVGALLWAPIVQAIRYSMTTWDGYSAPVWIGPGAYATALSDPIVHRVLENNALLLLAVPFAIGIPLVIAALLHEHVRGWRFFRSSTSCRRPSPGSSSAWWPFSSSPRRAC